MLGAASSRVSRTIGPTVITPTRSPYRPGLANPPSGPGGGYSVGRARHWLVQEAAVPSRGIYLYHSKFNCNYWRDIMAWSDHRTGRHLSLQVPPEIKIELLKRKALSGVPVSYQICEALRAKWSNQGAPPAVVPGPCQVTRPLVPSKYSGMHEQKIPPSMPWKT